MRFNSTARIGFLLIGCAQSALFSGPARAQQAPSPDQAMTPSAATANPAAEPSETAPSANDIIVTAQRRSERLESVPIAITAASGATLEKSGITRFQDLGNIAPAVQISRGGTFVQPAIRGVTTLTTGQGYENNVAVYVDGFYQPDTMSINGDLVNIADVQVLKGPQGTLYGRNATAGAILISTPNPTHTWTGSAQATYARFDDKRGQFYLSGPIADNLTFNVAGYIRRSDGYMRDVRGFDTAPVAQNNVRAKLRFEATDKLAFTASYNYSNIQDARGGTFIEYANTPKVYPGTAIPYPSPPTGASSRYTSSSTFPTDARTISQQGSLLGEWESGIGKLTTHTSYYAKKQNQKFDFDGTALDASTTVQPGHERNFQQSADLAVNTVSWLDLIVGGSYYWDRYRVQQTAYSFGNFANSQHYGQTSNSFALYADGTFKPADKLFLTAGVRYSHEHKDGYYFFTSGNTGAALPPSADKSATFSAFTPRAVIRYALAPRTSVYASYSQGFRTGTFPVSAFTNPLLYQPIKPERITAYELGFKTAGSKLRFDTAAYYYEFKNLQVGLSIPNPLAPTSIIQQVINAKRAKVYGLEGSTTYTPTRALTIRASAAWTHARYTDFSNATGTGLNAATGLNVTGQAQNWSGEQMARAPGFTANLGGTYTLDSSVGAVEFSLNGSYTSSFVLSNPSLYGPLAPAGLANKQRFRQGSYGLLNAQIQWTDTTQHITAALFSDNLTNTHYVINSSGGAFGSYRVWGEPITYGIRLGYKF